MGTSQTPSIDIALAEADDIDDVRAMLDEYVAWLNLDVEFQDLPRERAELPGAYAGPSGALLIARRDGHAIGMVALRRKTDERCEMKRLFVRPEARGSGLGPRLIAAIVDEARRRGYREMCLDTLPVMGSAQRLYEQFGFEDIAPYYDSPVPGTRYMLKRLEIRT